MNRLRWLGLLLLRAGDPRHVRADPATPVPGCRAKSPRSCPRRHSARRTHLRFDDDGPAPVHCCC